MKPTLPPTPICEKHNERKRRNIGPYSKMYYCKSCLIEQGKYKERERKK